MVSATAAAYTRKEQLMSKEIFIYNKTVYLGDTNAEGNVYFANYFRWQGEAREAFYAAHFPLDIWQQTGLKLITCDASVRYKKETVFYNELQIQVQTANIRNMSVELLFTYILKDTSLRVAYGKQRIAFADALGKLITIPQPIKDMAENFLIDGSEYKQYSVR